MLTALSIRDIVLIDKLDLTLDGGITVLTGETGAGKSILLDALGLALGARGDSSLVRAGVAKGTVTASFVLPQTHEARAFLADKDIDADDDIIVKRIQSADGGSRATVNDQPVSISVLRQLSVLLVELHGQHADRALVDVAQHRRLVDAFGGHEDQVEAVASSWTVMANAKAGLDAHVELMARAEAEREYIEHAVAELGKLAPQPDEERVLAEQRQLMMQAEQYVSALDDASAVLSNDVSTAAKINAALRKLERKKDSAGGRLDDVCAALGRLLHGFDEASQSLDEAKRAFAFNTNDLDKSEERLFALRAAARKHKCSVDDLAKIHQRFETDMQAIADGGAALVRLQGAYAEAKAAFEMQADKLSAARKKAAKALDKAVLAELPALKLERARFESTIETDAAKPSVNGIDRIEFQVAANPGTALQPLMKVASGGELARFMLALKVILAAKGSAPVLIFDEIDTGVGGAVADAIGKRLARLSDGLQVIAVTHSPQVAARADQHLVISKIEDIKAKRMFTRVTPLSSQSRREEIARMLSGATVTDEARAQAERLLAGTG